jgi:large subunit ribosomal protein L10
MNREQKAAAIAEIAAQIEGAQAILAVDYRGISVPQVAELRAGLRRADASFRVVKNSLTERAAGASGAETLKPLLTGPTALAFVRGDVATAAKAIADYGRATQLLPFKGGLMDGAALDVEQIRSLSRLPPRDVLYGQLVGVVASPVSGLVRTLNALLGGLAVALGQVRDKMQSGETPSGSSDAVAEAEPAASAETTAPGAPAAEAGAAEAPAAEATAEGATTEEAPAAEATAEGATAEEAAAEVESAAAAEDESPAAEAAPAAFEQQEESPADQQAERAPTGDAESTADAAEAPTAQAAEVQTPQNQTEPDEQPAQQDDEADASADAQPAGAEEKPAKED